MGKKKVIVDFDWNEDDIGLAINSAGILLAPDVGLENGNVEIAIIVKE